MVNVREFSSESEFVNPCDSYILCDVICSFCNNPRDIDLLRDAKLIHGIWQCTCGQPYNKPSIEAKLIEILQKKSLSYQQQDLVCEKCHQVKVENMSELCPSCCGKFVCHAQTSEQFHKFLKVFHDIAEFHKFEWLAETLAPFFKS